MTREALLTRQAVTKHHEHHRTRTDSCREENMRLLTPVCGMEHEVSGSAFGRSPCSTQRLCECQRRWPIHCGRSMQVGAVAKKGT